MTDEPTLKPCPFVKCGGEGTMTAVGHGHRAYFARCGSCHTTGPVAVTEADAADFWNDRGDENAEAGPRFAVGDEVELVAGNPGYTVKIAYPAWALDDGRLVMEHEIKPAPAPETSEENASTVAVAHEHHWPPGVIGGNCTHCGLSPAEYAQAKTCCYRMTTETSEEPAEPDDEIRVGDRVRAENGNTGTVDDILVSYAVTVDGYGPGPECQTWGGNVVTKLPPAPPPLPSDHIDRVWRPGARVVHRSFLEGFTSVIDDDWGVRTSGASREYVRHGQQSKTGWHFHKSSPIQTPKEP